MQNDNLMSVLSSATNKTPLFEFVNCVKIAKVVDVYDGDTLKACFSIDDDPQHIFRFPVRMYGYNSEEIRQKKDEVLREEKKKKALEQKKALENLTLNKIVYLECMGYEKYGRILGKIYLDRDKKQCVNTIMVQEYGCVEYMI